VRTAGLFNGKPPRSPPSSFFFLSASPARNIIATVDRGPRSHAPSLQAEIPRRDAARDFSLDRTHHHPRPSVSRRRALPLLPSLFDRPGDRRRLPLPAQLSAPRSIPPASRSRSPLIGTFGVMYPLRLQHRQPLPDGPDDRPTGFVVDDAIVVIEKHHPTPRTGDENPLPAAPIRRKGNRLLPVLLHQPLARRCFHPHPAHGRGQSFGRLFREFAVNPFRRHRRLDDRLPSPPPPMMCAPPFFRSKDEEKTRSFFTNARRAGFSIGCWAGTSHHSPWVLRHPFSGRC